MPTPSIDRFGFNAKLPVELALGILIVLGTTFSCEAQNSLIKKVVYRTWIDTGKTIHDIYLAGFTNSSAYTSHAPIMFNPNFIASSGYDSIPYNAINKLTIKRKGSTGRSILAGAVIGTVTGAIVGFASGDDERNSNSGFFQGCIVCLSAAEKAATGGVILGLLGTATGALIGTSKTKFKIDGQKTRFEEMKNRINYKVIRTPVKSDETR